MIDTVAQKFGESGDIWIARYGAVLKETLDADVRQRNDETHWRPTIRHNRV